MSDLNVEITYSPYQNTDLIEVIKEDDEMLIRYMFIVPSRPDLGFRDCLVDAASKYVHELETKTATPKDDRSC